MPRSAAFASLEGPAFSPAIIKSVLPESAERDFPP